jgi:hypothetical protein
MLDAIRASLSAAYDARLVSDLLETYAAAKQNFYFGGNRLSGVEAGRFCEAVLRMLEFRAFGAFTHLGTQIDSDGVIRKLGQIPAALQPDSIRLHIPRAVRLVYDIRNKRDVAHLADGIDANVQDATLVAGVVDWIVAELVRLHHVVSGDEAQRVVNELVRRRAPVVETLDGEPMVLRADLKAGDHVIVLLYDRGENGATKEELQKWSPPSMRANMARTLADLEYKRRFVRPTRGRFVITASGRAEVESRRLFQPAEAGVSRKRAHVRSRRRRGRVGTAT